MIREKFWSLIKTLAKDGKTVIVTTHYMDEAEQCERIAFMRSGQLIALDSSGGLKKTAYPDPIAEIKISNNGFSAEKILKIPEILTWWPYGLKYHAVFRSGSSAAEFFKKMPQGISGKLIEPSLEDVFIRLVEGHDR